MPAVDYSKVVKYKIVCKDLNVDECYVGHTTNFRQRKTQHKKRSTRESYKEYNSQKYKIMRENGGWEIWDMIEIEKYPCKDFNEARARERYWYEILNSKLNSIKPYISREGKTRKKYSATPNIL